ncbi:hypothetical protein ACQ86E_19670 [Bradyrhizobium betae]|uniref:hypothetical protein n=1 Tax=Bradyrhizobium betae TaxID=244734 RepID=UPI003D6768DB
MVSLIVLVAETDLEELTFCEAISQHRPRNVIPLIDRSSLPTRFETAARAAGYDVTFVSSVDDALRMADFSAQDAQEASPIAIIAGSADVLAGLALFLRVVAPGAILLSETSSSGPGADGLPAGSALLLDDGGPQSHFLLEIAQRFWQEERPTGLVPAADGDTARLGLAKALSLSNINTHAPEVVCIRRSETAANDSAELVKASTAMIMAGHGNPIDLGLGAGRIICGQQPSASRAPARGSFPCIRGKLCLRQISFGRPPTDTSNLIDPEVINSRIIVFLGCGTAPLPGSTFNLESTMVMRSIAGNAIAAIATTGITPLSDELIYIVSAALSAGWPLEKVAREASHWVRAFYKQEASAVPHFVVFGNPLTRIANAVDRQAEAGGNLSAQQGLTRAAGGLERTIRDIVEAWPGWLLDAGGNAPSDSIAETIGLIGLLHRFLSTSGHIDQALEAVLKQAAFQVENLLLSLLLDRGPKRREVTFAAWESFAHPVRNEGASEVPCPCGRQSIVANWFELAVTPHLKRRVLTCPLCGPVSEDDGIIPFSTQFSIGANKFTAKIKIEAPSDRSVLLAVRAFVEHWGLADPSLSPIQNLEIMNGEVLELAMEADLPAGTQKGIRYAGVIAVVNGHPSSVRRPLHCA